MLGGLLVLLVFVAGGVWGRSMIPESELCSPMLPNEDKIAAVQAYRQDLAPIYFWHLQKSGGTTFCAIMRYEYKNNNEFMKMDSPDCNYAPLSKDLVLNWASWPQYRDKGYRFVALEPSNMDYNTFPVKYYNEPFVNALLNQGGGELHDNAWKNLVHVLVIRPPLETAMSAFNYKFPGTDQGIHETCQKFRFNTEKCVQEMFKVKDDPTITTHKFFNKQQLNRIRTEILDNYMCNTFSLHGDFHEAKHLLTKFSLIIDLSLSSQAAMLMSCTLGWNSTHLVGGFRENVNVKHPTNKILTGLSINTMLKWVEYMKYDMILYGKTTSKHTHRQNTERERDKD